MKIHGSPPFPRVIQHFAQLCAFADLMDPIDVYSDWIDECEKVNTGGGGGGGSGGGGGGGSAHANAENSDREEDQGPSDEDEDED